MTAIWAWVAVFFLVPLGIVWLYSFGENRGLTEIALSGTLSNYIRSLQPLYLEIFAKSVVVAGLTTLLCLIIGFPVALAIVFASEKSRAWLLLLVAIWGFSVVADSAQFSALVSERAPADAVGTALTLQTALGFLLTMLTIDALPRVAGVVGWQWACSLLALGPIVEHLANLAPLLSPRALLGDLILGEKNAAKGSNLAFQELNSLYQPVSKSAILGLQSELRPPLEIFGLTPEIFPASYSYTPPGHNKPITVITPLKWVLIYKDLGPQRLRELVGSHSRNDGGELKSCVLHYLVMQILAGRRPGVAPILEALRFTPVSYTHLTLPTSDLV